MFCYLICQGIACQAKTLRIYGEEVKAILKMQKVIWRVHQTSVVEDGFYRLTL